LIGGDNPDVSQYEQRARDAQAAQQQFGGREASNYAAQTDLANYLHGQISGQGGPSVAQVQLRQGLDQNAADMMAAGAGASGQNAVLARYQARQQQGADAARLQQAGALLKAQEIAQAQQQLAALRASMGQQSGQLYGANMQALAGYDTLRAQLDQANAQRDTMLGAAGLSGASTLGGGLFSMFGGKGSGGG
jgi:hypothetical protein